MSVPGRVRMYGEESVRTAVITYLCPKNRYPATLVPLLPATKPGNMHTCG